MSRHGQNRIARALLCIAPLGIVLSLALTSCTVLGLTAGSFADRAAGKGDANRLLRVSQGTRVTMWLFDGSKVQGRLVGFSGLPDSLNGKLPPYLPSGSGIVLSVQSQQRTFPAASVRRVSVPHYTGKVVGTLGGLVADAAIALLIALAASGAGFH